MNTNRKPNRLIKEKSPYLLQHAYNPVDWYPWGEEAFAKAGREDKPIFLSVGYSTCYWCHVMEREVFENEEIANLMNDKLVCVKVDREERPDVDRVYMTAVQAMTGSGGWPMSVFLTPDLKPFFGATYVPPRPQYGRPGFPDIVNRISQLWRDDRTKILESSDGITGFLSSSANAETSGAIRKDVLELALNQFRQSFDSTFGGFGSAPKFPRPSVLNFLLRAPSNANDRDPVAMSLHTLRKMAEGGLYDHLGGGFHRYSVDGEWRVPHFEKMLYDQAQLVISYIEAFQITGDSFFAEVAKDTLAYVLNTMQSKEGGFFSAEDAESALDADQPGVKEEGEFYLWKHSEIQRLLGSEVGAIFSYRFGVEESGNALHDPMHIFVGKNILYHAHTLKETADHFQISEENTAQLLERARASLLEVRAQRPRPHLDDKIITAWNGLMISALAKAYQVFEAETYHRAALRAAQFTFSHLLRDDGTLMRRYRDGESRFDGGLQDYAFLIAGLLDLYESTLDSDWLANTVDLTEKQVNLFWDEKRGGFYDTHGADTSILVRFKETYDGAEPAGNSVATLNMLKLSRLLGKPDWEVKAHRTIESFGSQLNRAPETAPQMLVAHVWRSASSREIVVVGDRSDPATRTILRELRSRFLPNALTILVDEKSRTFFSEFLTAIPNMKMLDGKPTIYVCRNFSCQIPTTDIQSAIHQLEIPQGAFLEIHT